MSDMYIKTLLRSLQIFVSIDQTGLRRPGPPHKGALFYDETGYETWREP
jgi:hypothetical protein